MGVLVHKQFLSFIMSGLWNVADLPFICVLMLKVCLRKVCLGERGAGCASMWGRIQPNWFLFLKDESGVKPGTVA